MKAPRTLCALGLFALVCGLSPAAAAQDFYDINAYRTIYLNFSQSNWWQQLTANYSSQTEIPATMIVDGVTYTDVGVRFRGNTSYTQLPAGSEKKSFNIKTDSFVAGQTVMGYDSLNLNNGFHDPTFLREFTTYWAMRQYGPAPGCNFVKLYLNNQYWGVYINVQQPDKDFARQWWRSDEGNRYRGFPTSGGFGNGRTALTWLGTDVNQYLSAYQAKKGDGTDLMLLCDILNNTPTAQLQTALPVIFSVDQFYRYAAVMNIMLQLDSYIQSGKDHFLYHDDVYGQFHMFPFDVNESLGSESGSATTSMWTQTTNSQRPAFTKTLQFNDWRRRYIAHYRTIAEEVMDWSVLGPFLTQYHSMIAADVAADTKKIYTTQQFTQNLTQNVTVSGGGGGPFGGGGNTVLGLQPLIQARDAYLSGLADLTTPQATLANLQHAPAAPTPGQSVTITVDVTGPTSTVSLWSRLSGPFVNTPMFDDGAHGDGAAGDGTWGVIVSAFSPGDLLEYYVQAETLQDGTLSFLPKTAEHLSRSLQVGWPTAPSDVKINEFLASNDTVLADPAGEFDDWVELVNTSATSIDIGGHYLTDDQLNPTKWQIPASTIIPAGGTLLIWCDDDGTQGPLHASFKLSAGGEDIALFAPDGITQLDLFVFGDQESDIATGRLADGGATWVSFPTPTPDASNELPGCGVLSYSGQDLSGIVLDLAASSVPTVGQPFSLLVSGGTPSAAAYLVVGTQGTHQEIPGTSLAVLVSLPTAQLLPFTLDATGAATLSFPLPANPALAGLEAWVQVGALGTSLEASNGLQLVVCP